MLVVAVVDSRSAVTRVLARRDLGFRFPPVPLWVQIRKRWTDDVAVVAVAVAMWPMAVLLLKVRRTENSTRVRVCCCSS